MNETTLDLDGLVDEANRQLRKTPDLADTEPFTKRTVYYYVAEGLLPRASRRRGPGTTYPADFVDRLLMIRRLQKERSLTLAQIAEIMNAVESDTITRVAYGDEPLEIRVAGRESRFARRPEPSPDLVDAPSLRSRLFGRRRAEPVESAMPPEATERLRMSRESPESLAVVAESQASYGEDESPVEHRYEIGEHAVLLVDKELTPLQRKRLDQVVELLRSMLEEED